MEPVRATGVAWFEEDDYAAEAAYREIMGQH